MYVDEPQKDGNIPDFNISKIDICPFRSYQRSFRLFHGNFSKDIHLRSRLLCFIQNDHTGQTEFKICPFLKWTQFLLALLRKHYSPAQCFGVLKQQILQLLYHTTLYNYYNIFPYSFLQHPLQ